MELSQNIALIIFGVYIVASIVIEIFYKDKLFEYSHETFEPNFQKWNVDGLFLFITYFGLIVSIPILLCFCFIFPFQKAYSFFLYLLTTLFINGILKSIYHDPRPFWVNPNITKECSLGFGNPSGHAMMSICIYISTYKIITKEVEFFKYGAHLIAQYIFLFLMIFCAFLVGVSRLYLGVHSLDQIIYGFDLGIGLYFLFFYILKLDEYNGETMMNTIMKIKYILGGILMGILVLIIILYIVLKLDEKEEKTYEENIKEHCGKLGFNKFFLEGTLSSFMFCFIIGNFVGCLLLNALIKDSLEVTMNLIFNWNEGDIKKKLIRLGSTLGFAIIPMSLLISYFFLENYVHIFIVIYAFAFFCSGFGFVYGLFFGNNLVNKKIENADLNISLNAAENKELREASQEV